MAILGELQKLFNLNSTRNSSKLPHRGSKSLRVELGKEFLCRQPFFLISVFVVSLCGGNHRRNL